MVKKLFSTSNNFLSKQQSNILSAAVVITASSLLSAVLGLLRNRMLVGAFFDTPLHRMQLDAYWVAFRMPELLFQLLIVGTVSAALIPVFNKYLKKDENEAYLVTNSVMNLVLLIYVGLSLVIFVFAPQLTQLITSDNFTQGQIVLAAQLTRIILVAQLFFAVSNFLSGMIQAQQRFLIPALSPAAYNLGIILGILLLTPFFGIYGAALGVVIGSFLHLLLQIPLGIRLGYRYRPVLAWRHPGVQEMIRMSPPRILNLGVDQIELMMGVFFATALPSGSLTIINLAQQLMTAPTRIFSVPLGQASLPFLSKQVAAGDMKTFSKTVQTSLQHIFFVAFPAGMLLLILRIPLVRIAYGASEFPWEATLLTGKAVAILSIALFAQGGIHLLARAFYALQNTVTPLLVSVIAVLINIGLSYLGIYVWGMGVLGLAVAVSVATMLHFLVLLIVLLVELQDWKLMDVVRPTMRIVFASSMMAIFLWVPMRFLDQYVFDTTRVIPLLMLTGVASVIGGGVYLLLAKWLKIPEYGAYIKLLRRIGNWKQVLGQTEEVIEPPTQSSEMTS